MTIEQLIEELKKLDPEMEVYALGAEPYPISIVDVVGPNLDGNEIDPFVELS